jgi:predicted deacetylase
MIKEQTKAIISLHDIMPETLSKVRGILDQLRSFGLPPITLYVVPGRNWQSEQLDELKALVEAGYEVAAHGWLHETTPKRLYHRLHAALISRNVAEHLDLDENQIVPFIERSMAWFPEHGFPVPELYVPPAWALGTRSRALSPGCDATGPEAAKPFPRYIEILRGYLDTQTGALHKLPMTGYEVDTPLRKHFVRNWNARHLRKAAATGKPVRIGLHPNDFDLLLSQDLLTTLQSPNLTPVALDTILTT